MVLLLVLPYHTVVQRAGAQNDLYRSYVRDGWAQPNARTTHTTAARFADLPNFIQHEAEKRHMDFLFFYSWCPFRGPPAYN